MTNCSLSFALHVELDNTSSKCVGLWVRGRVGAAGKPTVCVYSGTPGRALLACTPTNRDRPRHRRFRAWIASKSGVHVLSVSGQSVIRSSGTPTLRRASPAITLEGETPSNRLGNTPSSGSPEADRERLLARPAGNRAEDVLEDVLEEVGRGTPLHQPDVS